MKRKALNQYKIDIERFEWNGTKAEDYLVELELFEEELINRKYIVPRDEFIAEHFKIIFYVIKNKYRGKRYFMNAYFKKGTFEIEKPKASKRKKGIEDIPEDYLGIVSINDKRYSFLTRKEISETLKEEYVIGNLKDIEKYHNITFLTPSLKPIILTLEHLSRNGRVKIDDLMKLHKQQVSALKKGESNVYININKKYGSVAGLASSMGYKIMYK